VRDIIFGEPSHNVSSRIKPDTSGLDPEGEPDTPWHIQRLVVNRLPMYYINSISSDILMKYGGCLKHPNKTQCSRGQTQCSRWDARAIPSRGPTSLTTDGAETPPKSRRKKHTPRSTIKCILTFVMPSHYNPVSSRAPASMRRSSVWNTGTRVIRTLTPWKPMDCSLFVTAKLKRQRRTINQRDVGFDLIGGYSFWRLVVKTEVYVEFHGLSTVFYP